MSQNYISSLVKEINDKTIAVRVAKAPSYLARLLPLDNIILIHRIVSKNFYAEQSLENEQGYSCLSEGDITGCPLEDDLSTGNISVNCTEPFDCHEYSEEKTHSPLPLNQARHILNLCNLNLYPPYPVWIVTDGNDSQKTVLLSSYKSNGWITRSWATYKGSISDSPSLTSLKQIHARLTSTQDPKISCRVRCTYNVRSVICESNPPEVYSSTVLQASWNTFKLSPPKCKSTEVTLITNCKIGKGSGGLCFFWRELQLINQYVEIIIERSKNVCSNNFTLPSCSSYFESCQKTPCTENPILKIKKILKEPMRVYNDIANGSSLKEIINLFCFERPGMDITDKFWNLFIECSTYQELTECFQQIFVELNKMGLNTPYITSSNISSLAECLLGKRGATILNPLHYIVEIGLDKLKKEILFIFSKAQIASLNSLNMPKLPRFSEVSASDWLSTVQKWLQWFCQMQCVLELLWNTQEAMFIIKDPMLNLVSNTLNLFTGPDSKVTSLEWLMENQLQEIKAKLPFSVVEVRLERSDPQELVLSLSTDLDGRKVESVFYYGLIKPFIHVSDGSENADDTMVEPNEDAKYFWAELYSVSDEIDM